LEAGHSQENLCRNTIGVTKQAVADQPMSNIGRAMEIMMSLLMGYHTSTPFDKFHVFQSADFPEYLSDESRNFLKNIVYHREGQWHGELVSMWSWNIRNDTSASPVYVYICTSEGYGSCDYCDPNAQANADLRDLCHKVASTHSPRDIPQNTVARMGGIATSVKADLLAFMKEQVLHAFSCMTFFDTYDAARHYVLARVDYTEVEFSDEDPTQK
jgi:hypothetical protein